MTAGTVDAERQGSQLCHLPVKSKGRLVQVWELRVAYIKWRIPSCIFSCGAREGLKQDNTDHLLEEVLQLVVTARSSKKKKKRGGILVNTLE